MSSWPRRTADPSDSRKATSRQEMSSGSNSRDGQAGFCRLSSSDGRAVTASWKRPLSFSPLGQSAIAEKPDVQAVVVRGIVDRKEDAAFHPVILTQAGLVHLTAKSQASAIRYGPGGLGQDRGRAKRQGQHSRCRSLPRAAGRWGTLSGSLPVCLQDCPSKVIPAPSGPSVLALDALAGNQGRHNFRCGPA